MSVTTNVQWTLEWIHCRVAIVTPTVVCSLGMRFADRFFLTRLLVCLVLFMCCSLFVGYYEYTARWVHIRSFYKEVIYHHVFSHLFQDQSARSIYDRMGVPRNATDSGGAPNCVVDIGANDGVWTSNSYLPIRSFGYHGLLFEMDFYQCAKLAELYMGWPKSKVYCVGLGSSPGFKEFRRFPLGLENTFNDFKSDQYDAAPLTRQMAYVIDASYVCMQVEKLGCATRILSVDVEGGARSIISELDCHWDWAIVEERLTDGKVGKSKCNLLFHAEYNHVYECKRDPDGL